MHCIFHNIMHLLLAHTNAHNITKQRRHTSMHAYTSNHFSRASNRAGNGTPAAEGTRTGMRAIAGRSCSTEESIPITKPTTPSTAVHVHVSPEMTACKEHTLHLAGTFRAPLVFAHVSTAKNESTRAGTFHAPSYAARSEQIARARTTESVHTQTLR
jgi:hypothetical protein